MSVVIVGPQKHELGYFIKYGWEAVAGLKDAGNYNDEDLCSFETGRVDLRKLKVSCPHCGRVGCPLLSPSTRLGTSDWRWVACEYKEPFATWATVCVGCKQPYQFTTYTPQ